MKLTIDSLQAIEKEYLDNFRLKSELTEVELYGLEHILSNLLKDYNYELGIEDKDTFDIVDKYTVHREDNLSILDGCYNVLVIGEHAVSSIYLTENNIPVLECYQMDDDHTPIDDTEYYVSVG